MVNLHVKESNDKLANCHLYHNIFLTEYKMRKQSGRAWTETSK